MITFSSIVNLTTEYEKSKEKARWSTTNTSAGYRLTRNSSQSGLSISLIQLIVDEIDRDFKIWHYKIINEIKP